MPKKSIRELSNEVDNYLGTIEAIISFCHFLMWDDKIKKFIPKTHFHIGRKMETSSANRIQPDTIVTPDFIIQLNENYGIIGEVKISFSNERVRWDDDFVQLQKYDDDLKGWFTVNERIKSNDIILLSHYSRKVDITDYLNEKIRSREISFNRPFALVVFSRFIQNQVFISFELSFGSISDKEYNEEFRKIAKIPLRHIEPIYGTVTFYDADPPVPLTMATLWDHIFPPYLEIPDYMEARGIKQKIIHVNVHDLLLRMKELSSIYFDDDERQPDIPKISWIRDAMKQFVELGYAEETENNDIFTVKYRNLHESLKTFIEEIVEGREVETRVKSLDEFGLL
ncbi:MAG: hypothetical protein LUQ32_04235 [Methanomicrobiales archaeon]|nr:hypothetical protein [Methanomicrobiales archaeon]